MLNKDDIFRLIDEELRVFRHYLNIDLRIEKNFLNPFYGDSRASCKVFFDRYQPYRMKDLGDNTYTGDSFPFVRKSKGLD